MDIKIGFVKITPGFFLMISLIYFFASLKFLGILLFSSILHETGHILAILLSKGKLVCLEFGFGALSIKYDSSCISYNGEIAAAVSGPVMNIFAAVIFAYLWRETGRPDMLLFTGVNFALCIFNLLPLSFLDGGRAVFAFISCVFGISVAEKVKRVLDIITLLLAFIFGISVFSKNGTNPVPLIISTLLIIFCCKRRESGVKSH
jgi:Zn-dependent protease